MTYRARTIAATVAAIVVALPGCGGDDETPVDPGPAARDVQIAPEQARASLAKTPEPPAAAPNVIGGDRPVGDILDYLDDDLTIFFTETLEPAGARITPPTVRREPGPCEQASVSAGDAPRFCDQQNVVFASTQGAEKIRNDDGAVALYLHLAWAYAQAMGDQMGWHDAVAAGKLRREVVKEAEACLMTAWVGYTILQGVFEDSDMAGLDRVLDREVFAGLSQEAVNRLIENSRNGAQACVGS